MMSENAVIEEIFELFRAKVISSTTAAELLERKADDIKIERKLIEILGRRNP